MENPKSKLKEEWNEFFNFATILLGVFIIIAFIILVIVNLILNGLWIGVLPFLFIVCIIGKFLTN